MRCGRAITVLHGSLLLFCLQGSICLQGRLHGCRLPQIDRSARAVEAVEAVVGGRAIATIVASGSHGLSPGARNTIRDSRLDVKSCSRHATPTVGSITRGEALICTTDE